jgi:hypothetical protein
MIRRSCRNRQDKTLNIVPDLRIKLEDTPRVRLFPGDGRELRLIALREIVIDIPVGGADRDDLHGRQLGFAHESLGSFFPSKITGRDLHRQPTGLGRRLET